LRRRRYAAIRAALRAAGVQVKDINVTLGAARSGAVAPSRSSRAGQNALLAALSVRTSSPCVDDDIDVFDAADVECHARRKATRT
jgi:2,5-furandicarboxylate decarboxylase 1